MADGLTNTFSPTAHQLLALARSSADKHKHDYIGPEHIADAMVMLDRAGYFLVWRRLQFDIGLFHNRLLEAMPQGNATGIGNIPYTALVKKLLAISARAAGRLGHDRVGPEHFLLAFFDLDTPVSGLFQSMGLTRASVEEAVLAELQLRAVNRAAQLAAREAAERAAMHMEPESEQWQGVIRWQPHQPIFGRLSLRMPFVAAAIVLVSLIPALGADGEEGMAFFVVGLHLGGILCIANIVLASIGLSRHENPRWPAITGLALSVLPALGEFYLLCGAPW